MQRAFLDLYRFRKTVTVYVENSLDQAVTVQILGAASSSPSKTVPISTSFTVSAGSADYRTLMPEQTGWMPYLTVSLSCTTAPTAGSVRVVLIRVDGSSNVVVSDLKIRDTATHSYSTDPAYITVVPW